MKLKQLIQSHNWLSVEMIFKIFYSDEKSITGYKKVFETLKTLTPVKSTISIVIKNELDDFDKTFYVHVFENAFVKENEFDTPHLAIELTDWEKWLGMEIENESLKNFSELEIISHCLYEMTFYGFTQHKIKKFSESLDKQVEEIKNMSEDERKKMEKASEKFLKKIKGKNK